MQCNAIFARPNHHHRIFSPSLQSLICSVIICAALSALCCLPIASTKSPSGSMPRHSISHRPLQAIPSPYPIFRINIIREVRGPLTHQIKINTMIHQIIHPRFHPFRRTEINPILLTHVLNLLPRPRQPYYPGMELLQIALQHRRGIARWVAGDEERKERSSFAAAWRVESRGTDTGIGGGGDEIDHFGELVEFFGADVGAVREAEVDLHASINIWLYLDPFTLSRYQAIARSRSS